MPAKTDLTTVPDRGLLPVSFTPEGLASYLQHISPVGWETTVSDVGEQLEVAVVPPVKEPSRAGGEAARGSPSASPSDGADGGARADSPSDPDRSRQESDRRAKRTVRRKALKAGLDHLVTLTFPGRGVHVRRRAQRLTSEWLHKHGRDILGPTLAVFELHPKGHGWHAHLLIAGRLPSYQLDALWHSWTDFLGRRGMEPSGGANFVRVDVTALGRKKAANYAAKYVAKDFGSEHALPKGAHRFVASHGLGLPARHRVATARLASFLRLGYLFGRRVQGLDLTAAYDGRQDGRPFIWMAFDTT